MEIKTVNYKDEGFVELCARLNALIDKLVPERKDSGVSSLKGLEDFQDVLVVYDGDEPVATMAMKEHAPGVAEVGRAYTLPDFRRRGIGTKLINKIEEIARKEGYKELFLYTWEPLEAAVALYGKAGFQECPPDRTFPKETHLNELQICMHKILS